MHLVGASSSHRPCGSKPLDTMVSYQHGTLCVRARIQMFLARISRRESGELTTSPVTAEEKVVTYLLATC
jgi:hypothetical protein